ncbi:MAG: nitroreductase family protein [Acidobacteriota bacterium]
MTNVSAARELPHEMTALEAIYQRRAVRAYTGELVDDATVHALLRAAVHAPTARHLEPWAFVVVQDRELLGRIHERARQAIGGRFDVPDIFYGAGTLVVICARPFGSFVTADCWLAAENLMLAATALGLATCPIGFALHALGEPDLKGELGIPPEVTAIAPIALGVPRGHAPYVPRHDPEILCWRR